MSLFEKLKRDIIKRPAKAGVLGVLTLAMVVLGAKAAMDLRPQSVAAVPPVEASPTSVVVSAVGEVQRERSSESTKLWKQLKETKATALPAAVAFTFDASHYNQDPSQQRVITPTPEVTPVIPVVPPPPVQPQVNVEALKIARIRDGAKKLVVKSTAVGSNTSKPVAIVNQQLVMVGHDVDGYEVTAIRAREVEFRKEGVTVVVKMPDEPRGQ